MPLYLLHTSYSVGTCQPCGFPVRIDVLGRRVLHVNLSAASVQTVSVYEQLNGCSYVLPLLSFHMYILVGLVSDVGFW